MRARDARGLVMPAHTLKSEARQFGGEKLGALSEDIEMFARACVESQTSPDEYLPRVVELRRLFEETLSALAREANPTVQRRRTSFGRAVRHARIGCDFPSAKPRNSHPRGHEHKRNRQDCDHQREKPT